MGHNIAILSIKLQREDMDSLLWLSRLISYDTTSHRSNLSLIHDVEAWLMSNGIESYLTYDESGEKANLIATIPGNKQSEQGGLMLSGHTDVVPVDSQTWKTNPFVATPLEDKIYGRGTCDMKGFLAVMLSLVPEFKNMSLAKPIYLALSYDEEVGCHGAAKFIPELIKKNIKPEACIVGEPTNMDVVSAHKGITVFHCVIQGLAAHSSLTPKGCNAIEYSAKLITYIRALADELKQNGPFDADFDVPFTSISTNKIAGGIANNIVPEHCEFWFECRYLPQMSWQMVYEKIQNYIQKELQPQMQKEFPKASITLQALASVPAFSASDNSPIISSAREALANNKVHKVAYATEAGLFEKANIPTIICGPGSIEQAHKPDEFITLDQLRQCENFLRLIVKKICVYK